MYEYSRPHPIKIGLIDDWGYQLREKAAQYVEDNLNTLGAERGSSEEQGFGALAEIVIRNVLGMPEINSSAHPPEYDILLPTGVKVAIKCRGGVLPFEEEYVSSDGIPREAKHNFFARQVFDAALDTDIYLMTHLETPNRKNRSLPGTKRQRKWNLFICGWVSKDRVAREGVYLPRGSLTEQGKTWFTYRGQEIEFYNKNLKGFKDLQDLLSVDLKDVSLDEQHKGDLNLTSVDAIRIAYDLFGRGVLSEKNLNYIKKTIRIDKEVKPILHPNQYFHLLEWLDDNGQLDTKEIDKLKQIMEKESFEGI